MLTRRCLLLAKEESSYGVDSSPSEASNSLLVIDPKIKEIPEPEEREGKQTSLSRVASILGQLYAELTFKIELKGSGTKGVAGRIGDLIEACGFSETVSAGSSVVYKPATSSIKSITLYMYIDGRLHKLTGAQGNLKMTTPAGKITLLDFTFRGLYNAPTDTAIPTPTLESTIPPVAKSANLTLNAVTSLVVQQFELDMANELSKRESLNAEQGVAGFAIVDRKPIITINPEAVPISIYDFRTDLLTTPRQLSLVIGSVDGNKCTITVPKFNTIDIDPGDREGIYIETIKGEAAKNSDAGDDEIEFKFE